MGVLRNFEFACDRSVAGFRKIFDLPQSFPQRIRILVSENATPHITRSTAGSVTLQAPPDLTEEARVTWVIRALLTRYGHWHGISTPPPFWLVGSCRIQVEVQQNPAFSILLKGKLAQMELPSLRQRIGSYVLQADPGWDYLVYKFIESGGLDRRSLKLRLLQFWKNAYHWSQVAAFFETTYPNLNPAELSLLWRTYASEYLATDALPFLSEERSLRTLERISTIEIKRNNRLEKVAADLWFLFRRNDQILSLMDARRSDLSKLILRVHPYYFNACHSLYGLMEAVFQNDLKGFQQSAKQFKQDLLDAYQLSYETDRLIDRLRGVVIP